MHENSVQLMKVNESSTNELFVSLCVRSIVFRVLLVCVFVYVPRVVRLKKVTAEDPWKWRPLKSNRSAVSTERGRGAWQLQMAGEFIIFQCRPKGLGTG